MFELGLEPGKLTTIWVMAAVLWSIVIFAIARDVVNQARYHGVVILGGVAAALYLCYRLFPKATPLVLLILPVLWAVGVSRQGMANSSIIVARDAGRTYRPVPWKAERGISLVPEDAGEPTPRSVSPAEPE